MTVQQQQQQNVALHRQLVLLSCSGNVIVHLNVKLKLDETSALLGCYTALLSGSRRRFGGTSVSPSMVKQCTKLVKVQRTGSKVSRRSPCGKYLFDFSRLLQFSPSAPFNQCSVLIFIGILHLA